MGVLDTLRDAAGVTEYQQNRADEVAQDAGGWFPRADAAVRHGSEYLLDNPQGSVREQVAGSLAESNRWTVEADEDGDVSIDDDGLRGGSGPLGFYTREDYQEQRARQDEKYGDALADASGVSGFMARATREEADLWRQTATGVDQAGDRTTTGVYEIGWTASSAPFPITRGLGAGARHGARMASKGALSARQAMKRPTTYMPERFVPNMGAPARQSAPEGVQGATGNVVRTVDDATTYIGDRVDDVWGGRTLASIGSVGAIVGGVGSQLGPLDVSNGNTGATTIEPVDSYTDPYGQVLRLRDNEATLGFVTITETHPPNPSGQPDSITILTDQRGTTQRVSFPPEPSFGSADEARQAYHEYADELADPPQGSEGLMGQGPYGAGEDDWEFPTHTSTLAQGWHLYVQPHQSDEDRERFIVAAYDLDGETIYLDSDANADESFAAMKEHKEALGAHERWVTKENNGRVGPEEPRPDPNGDRPTPNDVGGTNHTGVLGLSVSNSTLAKAGVAAIGVAVALFLYSKGGY